MQFLLHAQVKRPFGNTKIGNANTRLNLGGVIYCVCANQIISDKQHVTSVPPPPPTHIYPEKLQEVLPPSRSAGNGTFVFKQSIRSRRRKKGNKKLAFLKELFCNSAFFSTAFAAFNPLRTKSRVSSSMSDD